MKEEEIAVLKKRLQEHGYELYGITPFKRFDRISFGNSVVKISINLRSKISQLALDTIIKACIGPSISADSKMVQMMRL